MAPQKRMNHASCIYGGMLVISGGIYGEDNQTLKDMAGFDINQRDWVNLSQKKGDKY